MKDTASPGSARVRRSDARRNWDRVFAAAKKCFAEQGPSVRMEDIARLAGVGVGTLYRSFGNRAGLAEAIFREALDDLVDMANRSTNERDPGMALRTWLQTYIDEIYAKRLMLSDLTPLFDSEPQLLADARANAVTALATVLVSAQEASVARADIDAGALMQLVNGVVAPADGDPKRARLLLEVVLDGLAAHRPGPPKTAPPFTG